MEPGSGDDMDGGDDGEDNEDSGDEDCIIKQEDMIFNPESGLRNWLKSRGKQHCIDFKDEELR